MCGGETACSEPEQCQPGLHCPMGDREGAGVGRGVSSFLKTSSRCSWLGNRAGKLASPGVLLSSPVLWSGKQFEWKMKRVCRRKMGQKLKEWSLGLINSSK